MIEFLSYEFMRNALIAAILVGIACGIVGTYVLVKRIVFISGGISHAAFGGVGLGYLLGINPITAAIPFSIIAALAIGIISKRTKLSEDTAIGIIWATGMALGILFISLTSGYVPDLMSYLFGNILAVSQQDLIIMLILDFVIAGMVFLLYNEFLSLTFDEEFSEIVGIPTTPLYLLLLCLVALSVVVLMRVVGVILVIALLTIPSAIARKFSKDIKKLIFLSALTGIILTIFGLYLSYLLNLPSGATIVLVLSVVFLITSLV